MRPISNKILSSALAVAVLLTFTLLNSCSDPRRTGHEAVELDFEIASGNEFILPAGWNATLWAESPLFYNPTNMDIDMRGRIWVTEAVNYRDFNNKPENRLNFEEGDRVMIFGRHRRRRNL